MTKDSLHVSGRAPPAQASDTRSDAGTPPVTVAAIAGQRRRRWLSPRAVLRARRGATAAEFALVAIPFFLLLLGGLETALQIGAAAALDHAALRASRFGVTGDNGASVGAPPNGQGKNCRSDAIPWMVSNVTGGFLRPANLTVTTTTYGNYAGAALGQGGTAGAGAGGEIVVYRLRYRQRFMLEGFAERLFGTPFITHAADLVVRNEPFTDATC